MCNKNALVPSLNWFKDAFVNINKKIIKFEFTLDRPDKSNKVGQRKYVFNKEFIAASNYNDLHQFAVQEEGQAQN